MRRTESECVCCDLPCIDCGRKRVECVYCDHCGDPLSYLSTILSGVEVDGEELCYTCAKATLIDKFYYSAKRKRDFYRFSGIDDAQFIEELDEFTNSQLYDVMMDEDFDIIAEDCGVQWKQL